MYGRKYRVQKRASAGERAERRVRARWVRDRWRATSSDRAAKFVEGPTKLPQNADAEKSGSDGGDDVGDCGEQSLLKPL
eukprot:1777212-Pleurochrysis_carterae.AAC.1